MASTLRLNQVLADSQLYRLQRIIAYNRLEARPRTTDFTRSIRAEVRDPLWMLTRQWQFGEFRGEDAGSPVTARIAYRHYRTSLLSLHDGAPAKFDPTAMPLETRVERESIPLVLRTLATGEAFSDVPFAIRWGKRLLRMMKDKGLDDHYGLYLGQFPIRVLPWQTGAGIERPIEDAEAEFIARSVAGRIADGVAVWRSVTLGNHDAWLDSQAPGDENDLKALLKEFANGCSQAIARLFVQPEPDDAGAWVPNHLEYQFAVGSEPLERQSMPTLRADQYAQGHLDWHSFDAFMDRPFPLPQDRDGTASTDVDEERVESFLPAPVRFKGQPQSRFWEMEDSETNFGQIDTSTTGLLHLLLAEFGLIYSNDWFMLPHPMDINTVCEVRGILVDDTFGRHTFIRAAGRGPETQWQRFAMFHLTEHGTREGATGNLFYLPPSVGKVLESSPIERVNFLRDEMANMVWGVESTVPSQTGQGVSGYETTAPTTMPAPALVDENVRIRYVAGTQVPRNWIPFIPVHADDSVSEIRLQRARMAGGQAPRGRLLREVPSPYFVEEEEVPRAGVYVERTWQRTRWLRGRTLIWVGRRKVAGRGEGWSNLVFDRVVDLKP